MAGSEDGSPPATRERRGLRAQEVGQVRLKLANLLASLLTNTGFKVRVDR